ncbi:MAG TPA: hypothetical protein VHU40_13350 [Polyangia bacterium]|nr:hypothetical protein [Polyangia bacterium]
MSYLTLMVLAVSGGCYTNPINRAPSVSIRRPDGDIFRQQSATFTADTSDPDGDALTIGWAWRSGACPDDAHDPATQPTVQVEGPRTFTVSPVPDDPFCVWAFVTDRHQAVTPVNTDVRPLNQPPMPVVRLKSPDLAATYPLYTNFVFDGSTSLDAEDDPLHYDWSLRSAPSGFVAFPSRCLGEMTDQTSCLQATLPGRYVIALELDDGHDRSRAPATLTLDVLPDRPPCIATTSPPFAAIWDGDPTSDATFRVSSVDDDGDLQDLHYVWYYARAGDAWSVIDNDFPDLNVKADTFHIGDLAQVRVEIHDRPNQTAIDNALLMCAAQDFCAAQAGTGCFQRVTWMVQWTL